MLKSAQLYKGEILRRFAEIMYDFDYKWYFSHRGTALPFIDNNNYEAYKFASVDTNGKVIGYISYCFDNSASSCNNFGIISFDRGNLQFLKDVKQAVDDIFLKYNFNRLDFYCFVGNPALKHYRQFIQKHGGREVGMLKQCARLMDGQLHDSVRFEILKENYKK